MSKKIKIIIQILALVIVILAIAGYFIFIEKIFAPDEPDDPSKLSEKEIKQAQKLLEFKNMDESLSEEQFNNYLNAFSEASANVLEHPEIFNSNPWLTMARMKKYVKDYEGAEKIYLFVIKKNPINYVPEGNLADLYANYMNDYEPAVEHYWQAIQKAKTNYVIKISHYSTLVDIYTERLPNKKKEFEKQMLSDLENDFKNNADFYLVVAKYYSKVNENQKVIEYLEKALILDPNNQTIKNEIEYIKQ